jgi:ribosomal protein S6--L-glutamate ligase
MKTISEYRVNALEENTEVIEFDDLHVVVLGTGDGDGTFAGLMEEVTVKRNIKYDFIDVKKAWIADSDIEIGNVKIRNIDGKNKDCKIEMHNSIVFVRAGAIETLSSQSMVSSLQDIGFLVVNDLDSMLVCDNKMSNALLLGRNNIPIPRTSSVPNEESIEDAHQRVGGKFPVIIKTLKGTQGVGVMKIDSMSSLTGVCQSLWKYDADLLIQEFFEMKSDIRTLVIGGKILASAERIQPTDNKDFRNNVHQGATTEPYDLSKKEIDVIKAAARASGAMYCGVDHFVDKKGNPYIIEVNGSPGIRSHFEGYDPWTEEKLGKISDKEVLERIIQFFSKDVNRRPVFRQEAGYIETIIFDGMEKNPVRAKFDTGNSTKASMLHVDKLEVKGKKVFWEKNGYKFEDELMYISKATRGQESFDDRPVIEHEIYFNNKHHIAEIALSLKDTASEMLVNRKLMTKFKVAVNPNRRFILSNKTERNDKSDH